MARPIAAKRWHSVCIQAIEEARFAPRWRRPHRHQGSSAAPSAATNQRRRRPLAPLSTGADQRATSRGLEGGAEPVAGPASTTLGSTPDGHRRRSRRPSVADSARAHPPPEAAPSAAAVQLQFVITGKVGLTRVIFLWL